MTENYRIKKVIDGYSTRYYPQAKRFGLFWGNMFENDYCDGSFDTFEVAQKYLCNCIRKPVVEYLEVDCGETQ